MCASQPRRAVSKIATALLSGLMLMNALPAAEQPFAEPSLLPEIPGLPDALKTFDGRTVATARDWNEIRRPELKRLFDHYMYGATPPRPKDMTFAVQNVRSNALGGKAIKKEIEIALGDSSAPRIRVLLLIPQRRTTPVPVFVGLNFCGNHMLLPDPDITLPAGWVPERCTSAGNNRATDRDRGNETDNWAIEQSIDRGYAVASLYHGDIEPDRPDASEGVRAYYRRRGDTADWGTIAAWAWGISRAIDVLEREPALDPRRVVVVGHSRNGKAALVAAAYDERIALAIPLQAGCGGTAPSRGTVGESVRQINDQFPHWFNDRFKMFNDQPARLPFDQHLLIALCAPRPVLLPNALEDTWANPGGQFEMLRAADPVYRLLGVEGCSATAPPAIDTLLASRLGYFIRPGKHSMTRADWKIFLDYADRNLPGRSEPSPQ